MKWMGMGLAAASLPRTGLLAQSKNDKPILVTIFLRGGMDAVNAVVPYGEKSYYSIRPTIAIPSEKDGDRPGVIRLDSIFGLHPSLASLKPFWDSGNLAIVMNAGSPHTTRSHFDAQDFMDYSAPGNKTVKNGWLNRYLQLTKDKSTTDPTSLSLRALAMQTLLPRSLRGQFPALAVPDARIIGNQKVLTTFESIYGTGPSVMGGPQESDPVVNTGRETLEALKVYQKALKISGDRKVSYPTSPVGQKLRDIASVIHSDLGLEVASFDVQGWDHHITEGGVEGTIATMLKNLSDSLAAFAADLGPHLSRTLVMVMTEFGRTCKENGTTGTDHGHGSAMFVLGGAVKGGKIHGTWTGLEEKYLYEGRDLPVTTDFRNVFAEVLRQHMCADIPGNFFPDFAIGSVKGLFS